MTSKMSYPLAEYAVQHWVGHARYEGVSENVEEGMRQLFDGSKPHLAIWVWICDPIPWMRHKRAERPLRPLGSPLHYAAFCGLRTIVKLLAISRPQDVHSRGFDDMSTPLHMALRSGDVDLARLLVEHGADTTARDNDGLTPLHLAVQKGSVVLARLLVEHGADVTAQDNHRSTLLHLAVQKGSVDLAGLLVGHGADVKAQDNYGTTLLHLAVQKGSEDLARFLVKHGADVTAK